MKIRYFVSLSIACLVIDIGGLVQAQTCPTISSSAPTACPAQPVTLSLSTTAFGAHIQWRRNGTPIAGANNATLNVTQEGSYDAQVVAEDWKRATEFQKPPVSYSKAFFLDVNNGWMTGSNGVIFRTVNGGGIWTRQETNSTAGIEGIIALTTNNVWAVGDNNIFRFNGMAWSISQSVGSEKLHAVHFESTGQTGIVVGNSGAVYRTTNGGSSWSRLALPMGISSKLNAVYCLNTTTALIVGDNASFRTTTLNTATPTWTSGLTGLPTGFEWRDLHFATATNGWMVGTGGIFATTNGGINWTKQSDEKNPTFDVHFIDAQRGWAVGFAGTIARTNNGGATWTVQRDVALGEYQGVAFAGNSTNGWAINSYGMIWRTSDGSSWSPATDIAGFEGIRFIDANTGFLVGQNGLIFRTSDGGTNWTRIVNTTIQRLNDVYFADANNGWIACETGTILRTTNAGATWIPQRVGGISSAFRSIFFINSTDGWTAVSQGQIFATTNGGNSWSQQHTGSTNLNGIHLANSQIGGAVGMNSRVITTNGSAWTSQSTSSQGLQDVHFADVSNAWTVGENGGIAKSSNGGGTWTAQTSGTTKNLMAVHFVNATDGWACGTGGTILSTQSGGNKWTEQGLGGGGTKPDDIITDITFINQNTGWAISNVGYVLKVNVVECTTSAVVIKAGNAVIEASANGLKPLSVCSGTTVTLSATDGFTSYSWKGPNSYANSVKSATVATPSSGYYSVTGVGACGTAKDSVLITINPIPTAVDATNRLSYVVGETIQLKAPSGAGYTYMWTGPNGFTSTLQNPGIANAGVSMGGSYTVTVSANGCQAKNSFTIAVATKPVTGISNVTLSTASACPNTDVTVNFTIQPSDGAGNFNVFLLNASGQKVGNSLAAGSGSPLNVRIPDATPGGTAYKLLVEASSTVSGQSASFAVLQRASAQMLSPRGDTSVVFRKVGDNLNVRVRVQGSGPFTLKFSGGSRTVRNAGDTTLSFRIDNETTFAFQGVTGACGAGTLTGVQSARIALKRVVAVEEDPLVNPVAWAFPNPTTGNLTILFRNNLPLTNLTFLRLFDGQGREVKSVSFHTLQHNWDISSLPTGSYVLEIVRNDIRNTIKIRKD